MSENPYQPPKSTSVWDDSDSADEDPKFDRVAGALVQTRPWVRFISVMMFIGSGFMVLAGLALAVVGLAGAGAAPQRAVGVALGVGYVVMSLIYIIPAVFLWRYADRINAFARERSTGALASALEVQKSFWKFIGVLILIVMVVYAGLFVFMIIAAVNGALM